jgi:hypothetical protein
LYQNARAAGWAKRIPAHDMPLLKIVPDDFRAAFRLERQPPASL